MIKLFRHIRRSLIQENKMSKYFKYAIGEILLVVIGILIALQINNWNENRKEVKQEQIYLNNLKDDLIGIIEAYNTANEVEDIILKQSNDIIEHYDLNNGFYNMDSIFPKLNDLTVRWGVTASPTTLVEMINSGQTKLIRNANLRQELVAFNEQLQLWSTNTINNNTNLVDNMIVPEIIKLGTLSLNGYSGEMEAIFNNYSYAKFIHSNDTSLSTISVEQLNNPEQKLNIINLINYRHTIASLQKGVNNGIINRVNELLKSIEIELNND
ncbi:DUF6090 family protein [Winogradskyella vincentii]|uniref:Uncharacterized protein n=1 Tax=Winogradskyella vincentii TaxID=2877122 RepID=A0ABS7Y3A4_9FLAO|nr:DUF6090 family protein [Winogradskyella vincentii]MCA0154418.1 hypothetical protein [Winogradskyella vincentii]